MNIILRCLLWMGIPCSAFAESIGQFANEMIEPVTILSGFISSGSFIVGVMLLISALMRYMQYRVNPLASPLGTVFILLILGIMLICLPFVYLLTGAGIPFTLFSRT